MFGFVLVALGLSAFWYQRRLRKRGQEYGDCATERQIPTPLLVGVEQAVLASAATAIGNPTNLAGQMLIDQGYPCNGQKLIRMAWALDDAPLETRQAISFAATTNDPNNMTEVGNALVRAQLPCSTGAACSDLIEFVQLSVIYMIERNRLAA